jgi:hypothetical protein
MRPSRRLSHSIHLGGRAIANLHVSGLISDHISTATERNNYYPNLGIFPQNPTGSPRAD